MYLFATALLLGICSQCAAGENTYSVYLPKYVRPGVPYSFVVEILESENPVVVQANLSSADFTSTASSTVESGKSAQSSFNVIPLGYDGNTDFIITIEGKDSETGEILFTNVTRKYDLQFQKKFLSIFIQSDKAIYQPSQTIKFRAVVTTPDLLPYDGKATYKLLDPNSNIIIMESNAELVSGVVGSQFKLGKYATLGEWKIVYEVLGFEESMYVTVDEYKLPKFKVDIKPDKTFLHPGSEVLSGEISAKFTFGQPVKGMARIEITIDRWRPRNTLPEMITKTYKLVDGSAFFSFPASKIEESLKWNPKSYSQNLKIVAFVKDKNTGDEFNETTTIKLERTRIKVEAVAYPANVKPGLPYVAYIKVTEKDDSLLSAKERENLQLKIKVEYRYAWDPKTGRTPLPKTEWIDLEVGDGGIAVLDMVTNADKFERINFNVEIASYPDKSMYWAGWNAERFESPSDNFLQVSTEDSTLTAGDTAKLIIHTTEKAESYRLVILARGKLIYQENVIPSMYEDKEHSYSFEYSFDVDADMSPSVHVVMSFVRDDGEIVADSIKITVQASLKNQVMMTTSTEKTDAGMPVSITVNADAGSFVGLRAIDQSVLLLKEGNDITEEKVFKDLDRYGVTSGWGGGYGRWWWPYPVGGADVKEVFDNSGILVLTDALVYSSQPSYFGPIFNRGMGRAPPLMAMAMAEPPPQPMMLEAFSAVAPAAPAAPKVQVRSYFPESWIWTDNYIGNDGSTTFTYNTPDTITTWELSSFAVSKSTGLGVTKKNSKITVFRNFFLSLDLPPTMIRGEILNMKTTLFNYFDTNLTVTVSLEKNDWYKLIIIGYDAVAAGYERLVTIPSKDSVTVVFPIKLRKAGSARISVSARSPMAGDAVVRKLVVKPEGIPVTKSQSTIIDRVDQYEPDSTTTFDVQIPKDAVDGSPHVMFTVSGNIIGNALSNLGNLLQMPSGCGEQTMLSFAPDVFISLYLKKVGELTGEVKQKSKSHIQEGYSNELRYQRSDGSFSAFGSADRAGSTWLTAFVVKCFIAATQLESDLVEARKIEQAVDFIIKQQNEDGTFNEPGRVIHKDMQGGVDSSETTTAYILIAMAEGGYFKKNDDVKEAMKKAQKYLEARLDSVTDIYTLAVMAYALSLVDSAEAGNLLNLVDSKATIEDNLRYWKKAETAASRCVEKTDSCPFSDDDSSSSSVEITAYVLLTYVKMGKMSIVMPIVRWLAKQRGSFGGYHSTQDTVMAIQALSTVAGLFSDRPVDLDLMVTHDGQDGFSEDFTIDDSNAIALQMADLPSIPGTVMVKASGLGFADAQLTVSYNLPAGPKTDEPFKVDVTVKEKKREKIVILEVCSSINENRHPVVNGTGMFVISVNLPSGYTVDDKEATRENIGIKLVELVGDEVTGYFDELLKGQTNCMTLNLRQYAQVSGIKPQLLKAYDYYHPTIQALRQYRPKEDRATDEEKVCAQCGAACVGCPPLVPPGPPVGPVTPPAYCSKSFECPDYSDGLFYDPKSHVAFMVDKYPSDTSCHAPEGAGDSQRIPGLPGTLLDGSYNYIMCDKTPIFKAALNSPVGFTLSLLVRPTELSKIKYYTVFSIGNNRGGKPYIIFAKKPRYDQYWLRVNLHGYEYTVHSIYLRHIPVDTWTHLTVRLTGHCDAHVFVNGKNIGGRTRNSKITAGPAEGDVTLQIGRSHYGSMKSRGNFKGVLSSLDVWSRPLSDEAIMAHYNYYKGMMSQPSPLLSMGQVHHVVPDTIRHCFEQPLSAADMKERIGNLRTSCDLSAFMPDRSPFSRLE